MDRASFLIEAFRRRDHQAAAEAFERLRPEEHTPLALEIAANVYAQLGRPNDEIAQWRALCRRRPADALAVRSLASALVDHRRLEEASVELRRFLDAERSVEVSGLLAHVLLLRRCYAEALEVVRRTLPHADEQARASLIALEARALHRLDRVAEARERLSPLDDRPPRDPVACREIASTWRAMHDVPLAIAWFARTAELDPGDVETLEALASCHEQNRDPVRARQIVQATQDRFGATVGTERLLVRLEHHEGRYATARARGEALLGAQLPPTVRRSLHLELAAICQRAGEPAAAFAHATEGNRLARVEFAEQGLDVGVFTDSVRHVIAGARARVHVPPRTDGRRPPTFVVGVPRAGTTLLQQMLESHPQIHTLDETDPGSRVLRRYWAEHPELRPGAYPEQLAQIDPAHVPALREAYWTAAAEDGVDMAGLACDRAPDGMHLVDKLPLSLVRLQWLRVLFPDALAVVCLRDPRDLVWSNFLQDFAPNPFAAETTSLASTAALVTETLRLWHAWRDAPPLRNVELRYEDTTADPETAMRQVLGAMGLPWDPAVIRPHEHASRRPIRTPSYHDVGQPIHRGAQQRWRSVLPHLEPVLGVLEPWVQRLGYEPSTEPVA